LQSIGTGARQHLVDSDNMVWVSADTEMETFLSSNLDQVPVNVSLVSAMCIFDFHLSQNSISKPAILGPAKSLLWVYSLVGANTGSLQSLRAQLFIFVGDQVDAEGKLVNVRTLSAKIEDSDLRIGDTTVEAGLGIGLENMLVLI
jgi:hypothetical protein